VNANVNFIEEDKVKQKILRSNAFYGIIRHLTRGPKPKMTNMDGFLCSLMVGFDFEQLSTNRNHTAMERILSI
jgi:hypothetical protein